MILSRGRNDLVDSCGTGVTAAADVGAQFAFVLRKSAPLLREALRLVPLTRPTLRNLLANCAAIRGPFPDRCRSRLPFQRPLRSELKDDAYLSTTSGIMHVLALFLLALTWQPSPGHVQISIWPHEAPAAQPVPGPETLTRDATDIVAGKPWMSVRNVAQPTMTIYQPKGKNAHAAVVVFPGGGFELLAIDLEGTEICDWVTSSGMTCVLLKYRVPSLPYDWHCDCRPNNLATSVPALQDAQRTIRLARYHAARWHINPGKVGVIGFSAGGYLVAEVSTLFARRSYQPVDAADKESSRPDFAMAIYPGHLNENGSLNRNLRVSRSTPPTFLVQAQDDNIDGVGQSLVYHQALQRAGVPVEMHIYAHGGHAFGLRRTANEITHWPEVAQHWLKAIGFL